MDLLTDKSPGFEAARRAMGRTRAFAQRLDLAAMTPQDGRASTSFCLAAPGKQYVIYQPGSGKFSATLVHGAYAFEWFNPQTGKAAGKGRITAGKEKTEFTPPFSGDAVLYLQRAR